MAKGASPGTSTPEQPNYKWNQDIQFGPIRSMDEFLLDKKRYDLPSFNDLPKWNNRICANLLYYQSNYFIFMLTILGLISLIHTKAMVIGLVILFLVSVLAGTVVSKDHTLLSARQEHPYAILFCMVAVGYAFITNLPLVIITLFSLAFPTLVILIHASVRLRNISNKVSQMFVEGVVRDTVMAKILYALNIQTTKV